MYVQVMGWALVSRIGGIQNDNRVNLGVVLNLNLDLDLSSHLHLSGNLNYCTLGLRGWDAQAGILVLRSDDC